MAFDAKAKMEKTLEGIKNEMNTIRTGRASASMFDKVRVDYYGQKSPLNQVAQISIPEARTVVISPFDKSLITEIEKAILVADLGLNPSNDGKVIRITIPALTADRRKELVKQAKSMAENYKTTIRNVRRDGNDDLKKQQVKLLKTSSKKRQMIFRSLQTNISLIFRLYAMQKKKKSWLN